MIMKRRGFTLSLTCLCCMAALSTTTRVRSAEHDWLQFRGSDSTGVSRTSRPPTEWKDTAAERKNIAWKIDLPGRGISSPVVVGDRVFLTASSGYRQDRLYVLCYDFASGRKLWERQFWATGQTFCHPKTCMAAPTPTSDGKRIYAFFSCNDVFCLDLEGRLLWLRGLTHDYPNASNSVGMSSSPVVAGGLLVVQVENDSESFTAGLDPKTGVNRWKLERPASVNWTSPVVIRATKKSDEGTLLLQSTRDLTAIMPSSGKELWTLEARLGGIPSVGVGHGCLALPSAGTTLVDLRGETREPELRWNSKRMRLSTASPLVYDGRVFALGGSILKCASLENGEILWQLRLDGNFSSTPVAAAGHLYFFNEKGLGQVVKVGEEGEVVSRGDLGETILCTPAISRDALLVRSDKHLWKIARDN